ncbi:MAG TPA: RDD family protein, partial [Candidatus Angelobacter sp.]
LYFALQESSAHQATVGKRAMNIYVTDLQGRRISFGQATGRHFSRVLSSILAIGYIMVAFTEKKQGLHDIIAGTLVKRR